MHVIELLFWIFFAICAAFVAHGVITVFTGLYRDRKWRERPRGSGATEPISPSGTAVVTETIAAGGVSSADTSFGETTFDSGGDVGGGDIGGGSDYGGGGGDFGGGGSSGGW